MGFVGKKAGIRGGLILPAGCDILIGRKEMLNMAMPEVVVQRWNEMTEDEQQQAVNFIDFLLDKCKRSRVQEGGFQLGALKGGLVYIADDFDKTPEEFEECI